MTTDITELAQSHELRNKVNHRLYGALEFQGTSGEHATVTLSIDECKSIIAAMDERLALVEALEKAQEQTTESENRVRKQNRHICELFDDNTALRQRIAELESRAVKLIDCDFGAVQHMSGGSTDYCHGFVDGTQNAIQSITAAGIKVEAE
ncbi:RelE family toxin-antitoxin system [Klebsiella pneumoniae]|nr:hypothetical protein [Klebsiella pneumoniae]VGA66122.1 RelE family toxin-antitoxin system [Klebsiella pneumoniae]